MFSILTLKEHVIRLNHETGEADLLSYEGDKWQRIVDLKQDAGHAQVSFTVPGCYAVLPSLDCPDGVLQTFDAK